MKDPSGELSRLLDKDDKYPVCPICSKRKSNLNRHIRTRHKIDTPWRDDRAFYETVMKVNIWACFRDKGITYPQL